MGIILVHGDIADRSVDAIINAWNRNFIPHWLLIPQGVARSIRKKGGPEIFRELRQHGTLPVGGVVATGAGRLRARWVIHAAALHAYWRASRRSVELAATNAIALAERLGARSIAMPLLGAGTGGLDGEQSFRLVETAWSTAPRRPGLLEIVVHEERTYRRIVALRRAEDPRPSE
jgi:O-acetyl-ADP-ribose deacetylase (regulator of RNase III)